MYWDCYRLKKNVLRGLWCKKFILDTNEKQKNNLC